MRILQSGIYDKFLVDQSDAKKRIDDLTTQMSSGKKIQKSYEDSNIYTQTLRLDSEINSYKNIQDRTEKSKIISDTSDSALNSMNESLTNIRTKLVLASNGTMSKDNLESIAIELENEKDSIMRLSNSSVNGQYIFSGTAVNVKPIDEDGNYHGNSDSLKVQINKNQSVEYSIDGQSLFSGVDNSVSKVIETNVVLKNKDPDSNDEIITADNSIEELMGENKSPYYFHIKGTKHDGENFYNIYELDATDKVSDLIDKINLSFGEDEAKARLSEDGTIVIEDQNTGNSMLDFKMIGTSEDAENESQLTIKLDFNKSSNELANSNIDESAYFEKSNHTLTANTPMLVDDRVATMSDTFSDIASSSMDGNSFEMDIVDVNGKSRVVTIDLSDNSTFTLDGDSYDIYNAQLDKNTGEAVHTKADEFTMGQLNNIISLAMSGADNINNSKEDIDNAVKDAKELVDVSINNKGLLEVKDISGNNNDIKFSLYDKDDGGEYQSTMIFMTNKAVVTSDPQFDLFKDLDEIITAVKNGINVLGSDDENLKNLNIKNALSKIDVLTNNVNNSQVKIGAMTNNLDNEYAKATTMELNVTELQSKISDVDIAEAVLEYNQVSLNYQAMMSTISKVNSLSLLNYL